MGKFESSVSAIVIAIGLLACGTFGSSIEASGSGPGTVEFAIANHTPARQEVVFYRFAGKHESDATRRTVEPGARVSLYLSLNRLNHNHLKVAEIEIVGVTTLRDVEAGNPAEIVILEGTEANAQPGFREISVPTPRHAGILAAAKAEREAMLKRPDQPGYKLGPDGPYKVGDAVVGFWQEKRWYQAYVTAVNRGTITVQYTDGIIGTLPNKPSHIRHRIGGQGKYVYRPPSPAHPAPIGPTSDEPATSKVDKSWKPNQPGCLARGVKTQSRWDCCSGDFAGWHGDSYCCDYSSGATYCDHGLGD